MTVSRNTPEIDRYARQQSFTGIGKDGQARMAGSSVVICGVGALGGAVATLLARAGVGKLRVIDRDFIELHNLQRQLLFDEADLAAGLPKAEAAARKLRAINSAIEIEGVVADLNHANALSLLGDADVIVDGADNFEARFLINDVAVKTGKPWVYGACTGSEGLSMTIVPGETPCLRCVIAEMAPPGTTPTCDTAGIVGPAVTMVASFQATEVLKLACGHPEAINRRLVSFDLWENSFREMRVARRRADDPCPACDARRFEFLEGRIGSDTTSLCGRNAVQIAHRTATSLSFPALAAELERAGRVTFNRFMLKFRVDEFELTLFPDGRAIVQGTNDATKARALYARYVGN